MVTVRAALNRPGRPVVSVCVANYNGEEVLPACLDSIRAQNVGVEVEVLVHDDASTDASLQLLRTRYADVELLASEENVGFCVANNRMVSHARGEFVLLLNNDAALLPDALDVLVSAARSSPSPAILTLPQYDWASGELVDRGCRLDPFYNPVPNTHPGGADMAMAIGACLWIRRDDWIRLGGFPEWFESVAEDLYLCCSARLAGLSVTALPASGYRHRQGHTLGGNKPEKGRLVSTLNRRRLSERNKTFVLFIATPTVLVWPLLAIHLLSLCAEGVLLSLLKRDAAVWREIYGSALESLVRERSRLMSTRRSVQAQRRVSLRTYLRVFSWAPRKLAMLFRYGLPDIR